MNVSPKSTLIIYISNKLNKRLTPITIGSFLEMYINYKYLLPATRSSKYELYNIY